MGGIRGIFEVDAGEDYDRHKEQENSVQRHVDINFAQDSEHEKVKFR